MPDNHTYQDKTQNKAVTIAKIRTQKCMFMLYLFNFMVARIKNSKRHILISITFHGSDLAGIHPLIIANA